MNYLIEVYNKVKSWFPKSHLPEETLEKELANERLLLLSLTDLEILTEKEEKLSVLFLICKMTPNPTLALKLLLDVYKAPVILPYSIVYGHRCVFDKLDEWQDCVMYYRLNDDGSVDKSYHMTCSVAFWQQNQYEQ